jgi:type I restriction enzyme M protein
MNLPGNQRNIFSWNNTVSREVLERLYARIFPTGTVIFPKIGAAIATNKKRLLTCESTYDNNVMGIIPSDQILSDFLYALLSTIDLSIWASKSQPPSMRKSVVEAYKIPLPPLEVQKEIVAEIEGYQKVIDGARAVIDNYRPHIPINPDWPIGKLADVCTINPTSVNPSELYSKSYFNYIDISCIENESGRFLGSIQIATDKAPSRARRTVEAGDVLLSTVRPNLKAFTLLNEVPDRVIVSTGFAVLRVKRDLLSPGYLINILRDDRSVNQMVGMAGKGAYPSINQSDVESIQIPLPPLETQEKITEEIEAEQALVAANRDLIARMEKKIQTALARVWGETIK